MSSTDASRRAWSPPAAASFRLAGRVHGAIQRGCDYGRRLAAVSAVCWRVLHYRVLIIFALSVLSIGSRGGALTALMIFIKSALSETPAALPRWLSQMSFGAEHPVWSGVLCLLLFLVGSATAFLCGRLSALYGVKCVEEMIPTRLGLELSRLETITKGSILRPLGTGATYFARLIRVLLDLPLAVLTLALSLAFLCYISLSITFVLLLLLPAVLVPLYYLNRNVARENREMRNLNDDVRSAQKTVVETILQTREPAAIDAALDAFVRHPGVARRNEILVQNWTLRHRVQLVSESFGNTILVVLAVSLPLILNSRKDLAAEMIGYVVALRFLLRALQEIARRLTVITRFLEPAECLLNPGLAAVRFPGSDDAFDDDSADEL